jgi:hypothetical protein
MNMGKLPRGLQPQYIIEVGVTSLALALVSTCIMATTTDQLGALLAANGLGAFAYIFASEQITLQSARKLDHSLLKEMAIPIGPRVIMLTLFAEDPHRPDAPAGSHGSPRHMALVQASTGAPAADSLANSGKKYGCFLSHHKAACAMEGETRRHRIAGPRHSPRCPFFAIQPGS